ncbi:MAG: CPBP family glutamic-type intramembrane protease [Coprobacillus sp.]|nr:CPBP family glutamic-type intramembrane protease [Coprobacillus sp.]
MHFSKRVCPNCGTEYDEVGDECPSCHAPNTSKERYDGFNNMTMVSPVKEIFAFLIGFAGLQIFALIVEVILLMAYEDSDTLYTARGNMTINVAAYALVLAALFALVFKERGSFAKTFTKSETYLFGFLAFLVLILASGVYSFIISFFYTTEGNNNQSSINTLTELYPFASIIVFGIIGPLVEEVTYRVGLFSFFRRINRWSAYLLTIIIFALIHFDFTTIGGGWNEELENELINLPSYLIAAGVFCFVYERRGFGASFFAHFLNNIIAVLFIILEVMMGV